jgi:hypothetical protein
MVEELNLIPYDGALAAAYAANPSAFCEPLLFSRVSVNANSLPDAYEECIALVATAATLSVILIAVMKAGGPQALDLLMEEHTDGDFDSWPARLDQLAEEAQANPDSVVWEKGAGDPPPNCLDPTQQQELLSQLDVQTHHLATNKGPWKARFEQIANRYGGLESQWNKIDIKHRGPHPVEYHDFVFRQMELADRLANGNLSKFIELFERWVKDRVRNSPLMVLKQYWDCRRS